MWFWRRKPLEDVAAELVDSMRRNEPAAEQKGANWAAKSEAHWRELMLAIALAHRCEQLARDHG